MSHERLPGWIPDATDPTDDDAGRLLDGDRELAALVAAASEPLDDEVEAVVRRATAQAPARRPAWVLPLGGALVAAAALVVVGWWATAEAPAPAPPEVAGVATPAEATFRASGPVGVARGPEGTLVTQTEGVVRYDVDPVPAGQWFRVVAGDVVVEVVGTSFDVGVVGEDVFVEVVHGRVEVRHAGTEVTLDPGQRFDRPPRVVQAPPERRPPPPDRPEPPPPPPPPAPSGPSVQVQFAALLDRVESGERSAALLQELRGLATQDAPTPLRAEVEIAALELAAEVEPAAVALAAMDTWLAEHPASPRRAHVVRLRAALAGR